MPLQAGARLGQYEILAPLGAGGMGEVYRAKDTRLGREVAVKVLPASFSQDADRLRRFEQEARAASALNHPNIITLHDIGQQEGAPYVVSELPEGETLRSRLATGALSPRKATECARPGHPLGRRRPAVAPRYSFTRHHSSLHGSRDIWSEGLAPGCTTKPSEKLTPKPLSGS
jgi:hypothetical protein